MNSPAPNDVIDWYLLAEQHFEDIEQLNELVQGWDLEFHQLKAGRSPAKLLLYPGCTKVRPINIYKILKRKPRISFCWRN